MHALALGFLLLSTLMLESAPLEPAAELVRPETADPCEVARLISEQGACLRPEDCRAFDGWMRLFGAPRTEPLEPELTDWSRRPMTYICPALPGSGRPAPLGTPRKGAPVVPGP